ncbi:hypothetical protein [Schlesneria sp. DSM 10557]|uniref:hypothetical protein n=1 Tax=Schlesneria sp. DSM 10557 TaxID=3044399 RepID=UPI0035A1124F
MAINLRTMTKKELRPYLQAYRRLFEGWTEVGGEGFLRISGPIAQQVWFERLSGGAYRPATAVSVLVAKHSGMLFSFLDYPLREVFPRDHDSKFERVCKAMREQFVPSIASPLNAIEVCHFCEKSAIETIPDAHTLVALNAYLGRLASAQKFLDIFRRLTHNGKDLPDYFEERFRAVNAIHEALQRGNVKEVLDEVRHSEQCRLLKDARQPPIPRGIDKC